MDIFVALREASETASQCNVERQRAVYEATERVAAKSGIP